MLHGVVGLLGFVTLLLGDGFRIVCYSICEVILLDAGDTTKVIELRDVRIKPQCFCGVAFCSLPVVKIVFCDGTQLPGFPQVWLGCYSLVEILYGEDIVLIV